MRRPNPVTNGYVFYEIYDCYWYIKGYDEIKDDYCKLCKVPDYFWDFFPGDITSIGSSFLTIILYALVYVLFSDFFLDDPNT